VTLEEAVGIAGGFFLLTISARYDGHRRSTPDPQRARRAA
jgi:hypothetical protein